MNGAANNPEQDALIEATCNEVWNGTVTEGRRVLIAHALGFARPLIERALLEEMREPSEAMWGELARDLVMWDRMGPRPTGKKLYQHLLLLGRSIPPWLRKEIEDVDHVPPKGTVAACIWKAMIDAFAKEKRNIDLSDGEG